MDNTLRSAVQRKAGVEFRGEYRDMTLWVESQPNQIADCTVIERHNIKNNAGLWVIEFGDKKLMGEEEIRAKKAGIGIVAKQGMSLIFADGEKTVPQALGYDACGEEKDFSVISVARKSVRGPRAMSDDVKAKYMARAAKKEQKNVDLLDRVSQNSLTDYISKFEHYESRNSYSQDNGLNQAAEFVAGELAKFGFEVSRHSYNSEITDNVVAELKGTGDASKIVVMGAHFDSRGPERASPTQRAPGADDNGSGSAALVEFARIIHEHGATFEHTLRLVLFTGEEQGLLGSRAIARDWAERGDNVMAMFNADMIGYKLPNDEITLGYMNRYADLDLTAISKVTSTTYVPSLNVGFTQACCSDQQSFYENGFPSVGWFETATQSVVYPQYHKEDDLLKFLDPEQIYLQATSCMASVILWSELSGSK
jgi:hypothetical protein